ncbi:unnamed protein product [Rhizoctonia solani]|uniref:CRAL/TRIO N-terminal domain-containing protein n=1 Tax=Rhizoctonia solani TaxID=456999 RepID=A0A8H3A9Z2_9AGAM|nr:unnamed protein product [Rhizoctonia solani]
MPVHVTSPPPPAPAINPAPVLNEEQENVYGIVVKHYSSPAYEIPGVDAQKATLTEEEKLWLTRECLLRYLRASKWVLATTIKRLDDTLKWRREYGLYDLITPEHVEPESLTGKEQLVGYDAERRPALYMIPALQANADTPIHMIPGLGKDDEWETAMEQRNRAQEAHRTQSSQAKENSNTIGLSGISEADSSAMDLVS